MRNLEYLEQDLVTGGAIKGPSSLGTYLGNFAGAICGVLTRSLAGAGMCAVGGVAAGDVIDHVANLPEDQRPVLPNLGFH